MTKTFWGGRIKKRAVREIKNTVITPVINGMYISI